MVESDHWELDVAFKITGQGRIGNILLRTNENFKLITYYYQVLTVLLYGILLNISLIPGVSGGWIMKKYRVN